MDLALLAVRLFVGLVLAGHASQKLFGKFGGHGLSGTAGYMESIGFRPGKAMALMAGVGELVGGVLFAAGFFNPLAAVAIIGVMLNAIVPHWGKGPFVTQGGWELPVTYGLVAALVAFSGPGSISLDNAFGWTLYSTTWGTAAVVAGLVAGGLNIAYRQMIARGSSSTASTAQSV